MLYPYLSSLWAGSSPRIYFTPHLKQYQMTQTRLSYALPLLRINTTPQLNVAIQLNSQLPIIHNSNILTSTLMTYVASPKAVQPNNEPSLE